MVEIFVELNFETVVYYRQYCLALDLYMINLERIFLLFLDKEHFLVKFFQDGRCELPNGSVFLNQ